MSNKAYQVSLSVRGGYKVSVVCDESAEIPAALEWLEGVREQLRAKAASKAPQSQPVQEEKQGSDEEEAPVCGVHNQPMTKQKGRFGWFWSCHQKNQDGSFCSYRPNGK